MTINEIRACIDRRVIVSDRWGFGLKFYQAELLGVEVHYYKDRSETHLHLEFDGYCPIIHRTFDLRPNKHRIYKPT